MSKPDTMYLFDECSGIYIPQRFAQEMRRDCLSGVKEEDLDMLTKGPDDCEYYWEIWQEVLDNATTKDPVSGVVYRFYQDGGVWGVPEGMEWSDEEQGFVWPEEEETEA